LAGGEGHIVSRELLRVAGDAELHLFMVGQVEQEKWMQKVAV